MSECLEKLEEVTPFTSEHTEKAIKTFVESNNLGFGKVMNPLRLAIVGAAKGPHLFDIIEILGKKETIIRVERALQLITTH